METVLEIPSVKKIISSLTPQGETWDENEFTPSSHTDRREILIALQGWCRYMMNGSVYDFAPGTVGLISPGSVHSMGYTACDHDLLHLWIHCMKGSAMYGMVLRVTEEGKYGSVPFRNNPVTFPLYLEELLLRRWKQLEKSGDESLCSMLMLLPCQLLLNEFELQWKGLLPALTESSLSVFLQSYIRSRIGNGCSIGHLAALAGCSPSHVSHVFLKETGESVGAFINAVRIAHVREALKRGVRQKVIAEELGFSSAGAFWNWMQGIPQLKAR